MFWKPSEQQLDMAPFVKMAGYMNNLNRWKTFKSKFINMNLNLLDAGFIFYEMDDYMKMSIYSTKTEYNFQEFWYGQIYWRYCLMMTEETGFNHYNRYWYEKGRISLERILQSSVVRIALVKRIYKIKKRDERILNHVITTKHPEFPAELQAIVSSFL